MDKYQKEIKKLWIKEREALKEKIKKIGLDSQLIKKVNLFSERCFLDENEKEKICQKLIELDDFTLSVLMKDPKRQNIYEKTLLNHLKEAKIKAEILPNHGRNAYYLINDEIITNLDRKPKNVKSLDFKISLSNKEIFIVHKYTEVSGGSQDNQFQDVLNQISQIGKLTKDKILFCLDGDYYNKNKINQLKTDNKNIKVTKIENIINDLKKINSI
ncbi:Uncharacterised protein [Mycoplasmopsis citelli]|uniref:Uncharacterized protein n=1 Tax=Mycoplasmopsis citelli TaxID=171281 RepID=A0A449B280_9BACT|nr:hypothetical protein [Mycoplasmopsis citelli]VEU74719.1 Uncharacterised protein [Mycoplasmopsis citelli]